MAGLLTYSIFLTPFPFLQKMCIRDRHFGIAHLLAFDGAVNLFLQPVCTHHIPGTATLGGVPKCLQLQEGFIPVSYTHLDVYKRQVHKKVEDKVLEADRKYVLNVLNYDMTDILLHMGINTEAVSYTHLTCRDTYPRHTV